MNGSRIFVSHSHQDNDWCSAFVDELKRYGVDTWFDKQSLYVGAKWLQTIETELEGRDTFLVVLTPNSWSSSWVRDELALALAQHKRIISVLHQPTQVSGFITNYQMLNAIGLSSVEAAKVVVAALGLAQPAGGAGMQSAGGEYEYFEIVVRPFGSHLYRYQISNIDTRTSRTSIAGPPDEQDKVIQAMIHSLREYAKVNGLEELPEKGEKWYSYRFRRKKK